MEKTLAMGIDTMIHVGAQPNIIRATFKRLAENVVLQTSKRLGMRTLAGISGHPWLQALLPARTALLRAPSVRHVIVEDWLLEQDVG